MYLGEQVGGKATKRRRLNAVLDKLASNLAPADHLTSNLAPNERLTSNLAPNERLTSSLAPNEPSTHQQIQPHQIGKNISENIIYLSIYYPILWNSFIHLLYIFLFIHFLQVEKIDLYIYIS